MSSVIFSLFNGTDGFNGHSIFLRKWIVCPSSLKVELSFLGYALSACSYLL
jgi:hypothetical protein